MQMNAVAAAARAAQNVNAPQPRLVQAAHEFEAQMMKELLKPMTGGDALIGNDDESGAGSGGVLGEFASESLGRAGRAGAGIARSKGCGRAGGTWGRNIQCAGVGACGETRGGDVGQRTEQLAGEASGRHREQCRLARIDSWAANCCSGESDRSLAR